MSAISIDYHSKPGTRIFLFLSVILLACVLAGCNAGDSPGANDIETSSVEPTPGATVDNREHASSGETPPSPDLDEEPLLPGDDVVRARVNGSAITQYDLDETLRSSFDELSITMLGDRGRRKVLESLVTARAIAQVMEKNLDEEGTAALKKKVAAYREQLLVNMHLAENAPADPVTRKMVEDYYRDHGDKFGAGNVRRHEMIVSEGPLSGETRDRFLEELAAVGEAPDWPALVERMRSEGLPARHRVGRSDPNTLERRLQNLMRPLKPGQTSALTFIDGVVHVVRITEDAQIPPRPLSEVSAEIRKMLLPVQLKKAVKKASEEALKEARVEYPEN